MKPLIVIRPQPGNLATVTEAKRAGMEAHGFPLFEVQPLPWDAPDPSDIDALLIGSANAVRHGGPGLASFSGKPAYAVGEKTAEALREVGLEVVATGEGGLQSVLADIRPEHRRLLRLCGKKRTELDVPNGIDVIERIAYSSDPVEMPPPLFDLLQSPAIVSLFSREAAQHFAQCCASNGIEKSRIAIAALGPRVARAAGDGWSTVRAAEKPSESALLALAREMCQDSGPLAQKSKSRTEKRTMPESSTNPMAQGQPAAPFPLRKQIGLVALAFALGAAIVAWSAWRGYLDPMLGNGSGEAVEQAGPPSVTPGDDAAEQAASIASLEKSKELEAVSSVEGRLALLEDRLSRLDLQANAASGNAARAESLLIAFAARRMVDRGEPLRYLADQLKLRFANAQPRAVDTVIAFAQKPVTIDELTARLDALEPELRDNTAQESFWDKAAQELSGLFTVHTEPSAVVSSEARMERARVMLRAGRIADAVKEVESLPGAGAAQRWIADALRYAAVQKALDLIETTAMLEPRNLQDSKGNKVQQPSPIAVPATPTQTPAT